MMTEAVGEELAARKVRMLGARDLHSGREGPGALQASGREFAFPPRTVIFRQGDDARSIFQVTEGAVMLYRLLPDGRRQLIELLAPGGLFGCAPLRYRDCSVETLVPSRCLEFDRDHIDRSPALARQVNAQLSAQLCAMHDHVVLLGRKSAMERIASFLMHHVPGRGHHPCPGPDKGSDGAEFHLTLMRQEIADYLGLTIETVSRLLTLLKRRGILRMHSLEDIIVDDICRLCRLTGTNLTFEHRCSAHAGAAR